jgi:crossover junction endodeoxyribonuclease RuvC
MNDGVVVGIDPGITGGIVALSETGEYLGSWRTPAIMDKRKRHYDVRGMAEIVEEVQSARFGSGVLRVGIEKVGAMPRDGKVGAFSFGKGYGIWLGVFAAAKTPYIEIPPQRWQAKMLAGLPRGPQTKTSAVQRARSLFPLLPIKVKADWGMADAALIAEYTRKNLHQ